MRLRLIHEAGHLDVVVDEFGSATLGDLAVAAGLPRPTWVGVAPAVVTADAPLRSVPLANGTEIVLDPTSPAKTPAIQPVANIAQIAGWSAGSSVDVAAGDYGLGSGEHGALTSVPTVDPALFLRVTATAAQVHPGSNRFVTVDDQDPTDANNARGLSIVSGSSAFAVRDPLPSNRLPGPVLWNRPPRPAVPATMLGLRVPNRPASASARQALSWAMLLAPIPIGIVMAVFLSPIFALFILMSPVMMIARWFESGRTSKKDKRRFGFELSDTLDSLATQIRVVKDRETARRRIAQPDLAQLVRRPGDADPTLWERRQTDSDFLTLTVGVADDYVPLEVDPAQVTDFPEAAALIGRPLRLPHIPILADLANLGSIGLAGPRERVTALARSLVLQAATLHGPADMRLGIVARPHTVQDWDFAKWLPHLTDAGGQMGVTVDEEGLRSVIPPSSPDDPDAPHTLLVIDHPSMLTSRGSRLRAALVDEDRSLHAVVLADRAEQLPASCGVVVEVDRRDNLTVRYPRSGRIVCSVRPSAASEELADKWSRSLSAYIDPEASGASAGIESSVSLLDLLPESSPPAILRRWNEAGVDPAPQGVVGVTSLGPMFVDLATDGPHGLVAGTTGSGKSELLRTMVASMCAGVGPAHLNFVLIDFKGGGAFDICEELPHVVSIVTDLDEHLAERALRCLKAELRLREETLRAAGATDLPEFLAQGGTLPRLVVVIDEFATLAAELPTFLDSLVDIAQRGRSLGVHMILATQRPSGVLDKKVKANTNLRIALRVQDDNDSEDVIGTSQASQLTRHQPGRAFARFGQSEIVEFQTAIVTRPRATGEEVALEVRPFELLDRSDDGDDGNVAAPSAPEATGPTDLEFLVRSISSAFEESGLPTPRVPWPDPLPDQIDASTLEPTSAQAAETWAAPFAIVDQPDRQTQVVKSWTPQLGTIALYGIDEGPVIDTMTTIATGLAARHSSDAVQLYGIEFGPKLLQPLTVLPHTGAIVDGTDAERIARLTSMLADELQTRREQAGEPTTTMLLIDSWTALSENLEEARDHETASHLLQIIREGPAVNMFCLIGCSHERAMPTRVSNLISSKLLFRLVDSNAYMMFGLGINQVPALGPGRAIDATTFEELQVATYSPLAIGDIAAEAASAGGRRPANVAVLDHQINLATLDQLGVELAADRWTLPIGADGPTLATAHMELASGEHALVVGASGSGRSTTLATLAAAARQADPTLPIVAVAHRRSPLRHSTALSALVGSETDPERLRELIDIDRVLVLIDDGDSSQESHNAVLTEVAAVHCDERHMIAACRTDFPKSFDSWVAPLRRHKNGVVLQPAPGDGDALRTQIPLIRPERFPPGRGYLITAGLPAFAQVALPPSITIGAEHVVDSRSPASAESPGLAGGAETPLVVATSYTQEPQRAAASTVISGTIELGLAGFSTAPKAGPDQASDLVADTPDAERAAVDLGLGSFATSPASAEPNPPNDSTETLAAKDTP